jgi:hypothetical protein
MEDYDRDIRHAIEVNIKGAELRPEDKESDRRQEN